MMEKHKSIDKYSPAYYYSLFSNSAEYDCENLFSDLVREMQLKIKKQKITKMPAALNVVRQQNEKWNSINALIKSNSPCEQGIEENGFLLRLKNLIPEIFEEENHD